jgi:glycosyltransferase 2 family protein
LLVALLAAGAALFLLARRWQSSGFDSDRFFQTIAHANPLWLVAAFAFSILSYYGRVLRWAVILEPQRPNPDLWGLFSATAIGFTALVLFGRPGEFVRPYLIAQKEQVSFASQMGAWFLERVYDILIVLTIFGFALVRVTARGEPLGARLDWVLRVGGWVTGITCLACILVLIALHRYTDKLESHLIGAFGFLERHHHEKVTHVVRATLDGLRSTSSKQSIARLLVYSIFEWAIIILAYLALFQAFPQTQDCGLADILVFLGFVSFGSIVQIPGVGGGIQLVAALVMTEFFHLPLEVATGFALMLWVMTFIVIVPFGLLLAFHEGIRWRNLKELEIKEESAL